MIRVGISGTNWTGKTGTINEFVDRHRELRIDTVFLSLLVEQCPFPTVQSQTPEASRWMLDNVKDALKRVPNADIQLFDRSPVDILAFTHYAFDRATATPDPMLLSAIEKLLVDFDLIFYAPVSEEWPEGISPTPQEIGFALLMDWYMRKMIKNYAIDLVWLPWSLPDRQTVLSRHLTP